MDPAGIPALQDAIRHLHGVESNHVETVHVREMHEGRRFRFRFARSTVGGISCLPPACRRWRRRRRHRTRCFQPARCTHQGPAGRSTVDDGATATKPRR